MAARAVAAAICDERCTDVPALDDEQRIAAGPLEATKHDMLVAKAARDNVPFRTLWTLTDSHRLSQTLLGVCTEESHGHP